MERLERSPFGAVISSGKKDTTLSHVLGSQRDTFTRNDVVRRPQTQVVKNRDMREQAIYNKLLDQMVTGIRSKYPQIDLQFLISVASEESKKALHTQQMITTKHISDLEQRIIKLCTNEHHILKENQKSLLGSTMHSKTKSHGKIQTKDNLGITPKYGIANETTYQRSFIKDMEAPLGSKIVQQMATPKTTSLWFNDFGVQEDLKHDIKKKHQNELNHFLKVQDNRHFYTTLGYEAQQDKAFIKQMEIRNQKLSKEEKLKLLEQRKQRIQESRVLLRQRENQLQQMKTEKALDTFQDQVQIKDNIFGMFRDRQELIDKRKAAMETQDFLRLQMNYSNEKLAQEKASDIEQEKAFLKVIGAGQKTKKKTATKRRIQTAQLQSGVQSNSQMRNTLFDQFYNSNSSHKSQQLHAQTEARAVKIREQLEMNQKQKYEEEQQRLEYLEKNALRNMVEKDMKVRTFRQDLLKQAQEIQRTQMREQLLRLKKDTLDQNEDEKKVADKAASTFYRDQLMSSQQKRDQHKILQRDLSEQFKQQTNLRLLESLM